MILSLLFRENNELCSAKGPLPEEVVNAMNNIWLELSPYVPTYGMSR